MKTATNNIGNKQQNTFGMTIGRLQSSRKGEIVLVYLHKGETASSVVRYDQLSPKERRFVKAIAQDPLNVLDRVNTPHPMAQQAA